MPFDSLPIIRRLDKIDRSILEAARYIQEFGWIQRESRDLKGQVCIYGALSEFGNMYLVHTAMERIQKYIGVKNIVNWNDGKGRTKEEVVDALQGTVYRRIRKGRN
jgi:hypothetical protein